MKGLIQQIKNYIDYIKFYLHSAYQDSDQSYILTYCDLRNQIIIKIKKFTNQSRMECCLKKKTIAQKS